jgi:xanthine/uracil permease
MKRTLIILIGIFAVLFGPAVFLPALAKYRQIAVWNSEVIVPMVVGVIITLIGVSTAIYGFKKRKA